MEYGDWTRGREEGACTSGINDTHIRKRGTYLYEQTLDPLKKSESSFIQRLMKSVFRHVSIPPVSLNACVDDTKYFLHIDT